MNDALQLNALQRLALDEAARFRLLADSVPVLIALFQRDNNRCLYANRHYAETFGCTPESVIGRTVSEIIGTEAAALIEPQVARCIEHREAVSYERLLQPDGPNPQWIEVNLLPHADSSGAVIGAFVLITDITKHRQAEAALRESELRLEKFLLATMEGIVFHKGGSISDANPPLCALLGYSREELVGRYVLDFVAEGERERVGQVMREGQELRYESQLLHRSGELVPVELIARTMIFGGQAQRMNIVRDIRDRVAAQARIRHLALHDGLTGLMNRAAFMEHLQQALPSAAQDGRQLALLFVDLNDFKRVNDSLGHLEGDRVLVTVAERLRACLRASDQVARFGGDEFVILLDDIHGPDDVLTVLHALLSVVEVPVESHGRTLSVTPSIGIAMYPEHGNTPDLLIQHADTAMYEAKSRGGKEFRFFHPSMAASAYADLVIESQLRDALARGEFELYYQPQVEPVHGKLVSAEALLRWRHPERGILTPDAFIAVAERRPLMVPLSHWVLRQAALQAQDWHRRGIAAVPIAVNLSHMQFRLHGFAETVREVLAEVQVPGPWLQLELTERMLIDNVETAIGTLSALRELGLSIAVDDFGTGHTALAHLTQLPLDKLKIDQSFVAGLPQERGAVAVTQAIVQMAKGLGLRVGAEGVRRADQWAQLQAWGCDELQGVDRKASTAGAVRGLGTRPGAFMSEAMHTHLRRKLAATDGGWLSFDDFMAEALYAPGMGYYSSGRPTFGLGPQSGSDFVTAPEISPFFGRCLARQVGQAMAATGCQAIWEFGAGSGALAGQLLESLDASSTPAAEYVIVELSASLRDRQQARLAQYGHRVRWVDHLPEQLEGILVGNEVLDAMPVKLLHFDGQHWFERGVGLDLDGRLRWSDKATSLRPPYDHGQWVPGTVTEIHPHAKAWVHTIASSLRRGAMFLIDYGFTDAEYYHPQRLGGTLMCHHLHQSDADPLVQVGDKDITAHVNFTSIALTGQDAGLDVLGYTSQAHFLLNCGLTDMLSSASPAERGMAQKLITEHEMGELFKVIGFATGAAGFDALGFSNGDRSHRL